MHLIELNAERDTYADLFYDQRRCIYRSCMLPFTNTQNHNRNETYIQPYVRTCYFFQTLAWRGAHGFERYAQTTQRWHARNRRSWTLAKLKPTTSARQMVAKNSACSSCNMMRHTLLTFLIFVKRSTKYPHSKFLCAPSDERQNIMPRCMK